MIQKNSVVDSIWKTRHKVTPDIVRNDAPSVGSILNDANGTVGCVEQLGTESQHSSLVKLCCFDKFRLSIRVVNQAHPIARCSACMTSS